MKVKLIAATQFNLPRGYVPWEPDDSAPHSGSALVEFAGRACYQSWSRPNPKTATNAGYLAHIVDVGHFSVLEHASATFYIEGVSRSLTHELVRHRHFSYSQLSQRYVDESDTDFIQAPLIGESKRAAALFESAMADVRGNYNQLVATLHEEFPGKSRKEIRQAARAVLPNATETKIVVTGNYRSWWNFLLLRATPAADVEIRALAVEILRQLWDIAPAVFTHFEIHELGDGTEVAELN